MPKMRRRIVKRVSLVAAGVVLWLVSYLASLPLAARVADRFPAVTPILYPVYYPIDVALKYGDGAPGHAEYLAYLRWAGAKLRDRADAKSD